MKTIAHLFVTILSCIELVAQTPPLSWVKTFEPLGGAINEIHDLTHDSKGYCYVIGSFVDEIDFDPSPATYSFTAPPFGSNFLVKLSPAGNLQWAKTWYNKYGEYTRLAVDSNDNLYLAGAFVGTETFPLPNTTYTVKTNRSGIIMKLSTKGDFLWVRELPGNIFVKDLTITNDQEPVIIGEYQGTVNFDRDTSTNIYTSGNSGSAYNLFFSKFSKTGKIRFVKTFTSYQNFRAHALTTGNDKEIYISAHSSLTVDINPGIGTTLCSGAMVVKYDSLGEYVQYLRLTGDIKVPSLAYANGILGCGILTGTTDCNFNKGAQTLTTVVCNPSNAKGLFFLLDTALIPSFIKELEPGVNQTSFIRNMRMKPQNSSLYLFAEFDGQYDFDPSVGIVNLQSTAPLYNHLNLAIAKYTNLGAFDWAVNIGPAGFSNLPCNVDKNEAIFTSARYDDAFDVDPLSSTYNLTTPPRRNAFVSRLFDCRPELKPTLYINQSIQYICEGELVKLQAYGADFYYWQPDAENISTFSLIATSSRTIEVVGFNNVGCYSSAVYSVTTDACTGMTEHGNSAFQIYPVPSNGEIKVLAKPGYNIIISDTSGKIIRKEKLESSETLLDIRDLAAGIYLVQLSDESNRIVQNKKMVKK